MSYQIRKMYVCLCGLGPPMTIGIGADYLRHPLERAPAFHLPVLQFVHVAEVAIGQRLVRQRPQSLGWLQLGRIRGQEVQMNPRGQLHLGTHMPASTVESSRTCLPCPAPTAWANSRSASVNAASDTVGSRSHHVRPDRGCTRA